MAICDAPAYIGVGAALLTLCILHYWMLSGRSVGPGTKRLAAAALIPRPRTVHVSSTPPPHLHLRPHPSRTTRSVQTSAVMLQGAVQKHSQQQNARAQASSQNFFSTSPAKPASQKPASQSTVNPSYRNPLKPASVSVYNGAGSVQPRHQAASGIKRTASGLAKALDGSFEDEPGSQKKPIVIQFDENDFDSDIDLDVEEPKASYPPLPRPPQQGQKPVFYPTLPKQQNVQVSQSVPADSAYGSTHRAPTEHAPSSSREVPWSSSPLEHFSAANPQLIHRYGYQPPNIVQAKQNGPPPPQPAKRRTLPWQTQGIDEAQRTQSSSHSTASTKSKIRSAYESTPQANESKKSTYPWNTTASAIKEQQKKLREENRKTQVKKNEGTEEDMHKAKTSRARLARVFLSEEQQHVLDLVTEQKSSVFFTGSAGTGKSVLLREIISSLRNKYKREPDRVAVTASTGLAACNVGGVTLHSFAGIGLGKEDATELVRKIKKNQKAKHRWMRTKVLIIDEVSMVDADLFDKLESIARQLRNNGRPFGGIQLIITGDFFQLPPVPDSGRVSRFAFDAATWTTTIEHTIGLHHVFRQKDPIFAGMLNEMREGRLTQSSIKAFQNLSRPLKFEDDLEATELFPTRNEVDRANSTRLHMLQGQSYTFDARDGGAIVDKLQRDKLLSNCMAPELTTLKKGAQVMLIKNVDESLVNGSIGRVLGFMSEEKFDSYSENDSNPLTSSGGINNDVPLAVLAEQKARNRVISTTREFPVVRFVIADGTSRDLLCQPETWKVELPNGEVQASRSQVPLILAWALSIHKAQGQTLERVKVDLGKVFEKGQAYVALSRATSMAGLQVTRFDPKKVVAHDRVRNFYSNLARVELVEKNKDRVEGAKNVRKLGKAEDYEKNVVDGAGWGDLE